MKNFNDLPRFDGAEAWAKLTAEQQAVIGAIALEMIVTQRGIDYASEEATNRWLTPFKIAEALLEEALIDNVSVALITHFPQLFNDDAPLVLIPSILGPVCRVCLCSEYDPCDGGCSWVEDDLCSRCMAKVPRCPATHQHAEGGGS